MLTEVKDGLVPLIKAVTSKPQVHHHQRLTSSRRSIALFSQGILHVVQLHAVVGYTRMNRRPQCWLQSRSAEGVQVVGRV